MTKVFLRQTSQWLHKWLALFVGIQVVLWMVGFAVLALIPIRVIQDLAVVASIGSATVTRLGRQSAAGWAKSVSATGARLRLAGRMPPVSARTY